MPTIMVATDLSTRSDRALRRATLLARSSGASLNLVHVIDDDLPGTLLDAARREARALLHELAETVRAVDGVDCISQIVVGDPFVRLTDVAHATGAELLVMGPHRRQLLVDQFRGTTVERTLRRSRVPVLVANAVPSSNYSVALVPTDLQPAACRVASLLQHLPLGGALTFVALHIYDPIGALMMSRAMATGEQREAYNTEERRTAEAALADFAATCGLSDAVLREVRALTATVGLDICSAAHEMGTDLIVLSSSNKGWVERAMLGSVTESVLRDADKDVLVMPAPIAESEN